MNRKFWLGATLMAGLAMTAAAQESRQDVSISATGIFTPHTYGQGNQVYTDPALGALASYRFQVTPRSALEVNYAFSQYQTYLYNSSNTVQAYQVHTRQQEVSAAYVYSRNYRRYNPFVEVGVGAVLLSGIRDFATQVIDAGRTTDIGGLFGGGVAYELSPSFDIRAEYRGLFVKTPDFGINKGAYSTGRYEVISTPAIGIAYHF